MHEIQFPKEEVLNTTDHFPILKDKNKINEIKK